MNGRDANKQYESLARYLHIRPETNEFRVNEFCKKIISYFGFNHDTRLILIGYKEDVHSIMDGLRFNGISSDELLIEGNDLTTDCESDVCNIEKLNPINENDWDYVFFCSRWHAEYITQLLLYNSIKECRIIDIYEWHEFLLGERPVHSITYNANGHPRMGKRVNNYDAIYCKRKAFENSLNNEEKEFFLELIIEDYFYLRDIISLKKYIDIYQNIEAGHLSDYIFLIEKVESFLESIKKELEKHSGIIVFWTDAVSHKDTEEYGFLSEIKNRALVFENAYTHIPYTDTTLHSMITGSPYFEDCDPGGYDRSNCKSIVQKKDIIPWLQENDYAIKENMFYLELYHPEINSTIKSDYYVGYKYKPASLMLWDAMVQVLDTSQKIFLICHCSDNETHHPYWHGEAEFMDIGKCSPLADEKSFIHQKKVSYKYVEKEILYFQNFYSDNSFYKIFMGDHGKGTPAYIEERIHSMFMLSGPKIKKGVERRFFSLLSFPNLIKWLHSYSDELYDSLFADYILVENQDPYSERYTNEVFESFSSSKELFDAHYPEWAAFRCVLDGKYKIVLFRNGRIEFFILPEEKWVSASELDDDIKRKYINLLGNVFEDLNMPKLVFSKKLNEKFQCIGYL